MGRIYENLRGEKWVFLGNVTTTQVHLQEPDRSYRDYHRPVTGVLVKKQVTGMLFYTFQKYEKNTTEVEIITYKFDIKKTHALRVDTGIDAKIPYDWLARLKTEVYDEAMKRSNESSYPYIKSSVFNEIYYMNSLLANIDEMHPAYVRALAL